FEEAGGFLPRRRPVFSRTTVQRVDRRDRVRHAHSSGCTWADVTRSLDPNVPAPDVSICRSALIRRDVMRLFWPWRGRAAGQTDTMPYRQTRRLLRIVVTLHETEVV